MNKKYLNRAKMVLTIGMTTLLATCGMHPLPTYAHPGEVFMSNSSDAIPEPCMIQVSPGVYVRIRDAVIIIEGDKVFMLLPDGFKIEVRFLTPKNANEYVHELVTNPKCA